MSSSKDTFHVRSAVLRRRVGAFKTGAIAVSIAAMLSVSVTGCLKSTKNDQDPDSPQAAAGFPTDYTTWKKVNEAIREEEKIARVVYANVKDGMGAGTILVKEQYAYVDGAKGALKLVAVMTRGADTSKNKGWSFTAFDPATKASIEDTASCTGCHSLQEDNDFLFTDRSKF